MNRQKRWLERGYTQEQIDNHLKYERFKAQQIRERKKKNNEKNKELITQIKKDLIGNIFNTGNIKVKILSISPSVDGVGFWCKMNKTFKDDSSGDFRQFYYFEDYNKKEFIKLLRY